MNTTKESLQYQDKPIPYSNKQEIFTDLDLDINEMDALIQIFWLIWPFKYLQSKKYIYAKIDKQDEWKQKFNWINFYFYKNK